MAPRYMCPIIQKKVCPYKGVESFYADERCTTCTIPEIYIGINPNKVPESHCEAGSRITSAKKCKTKGEEREMRKLYEYLMQNSNVFRNLGMDQQGELIIKMMDAIKKG